MTTLNQDGDLAYEVLGECEECGDQTDDLSECPHCGSSICSSCFDEHEEDEGDHDREDEDEDEE